MLLKTLTLNGFKGFKDKTSFQFKPGIGAIVGPNGCGKSNIIDAFKWVWGEQRIFELRGEKLEDLIFSGSNSSPPSNFCEVEVIFDNRNKYFSLNFTEISITRRIYRSGETENFINHKSCRLKDIIELLNNTGLGKSNYSTIEQGKIDRIFSEKPENRRKIFEENAALADYKFKMKEYYLKIKQTNENLFRLKDIFKIKLKQKETLREQVKKSQKYFKLEEDKKTISKKIFSHEYYLLNLRGKTIITEKRKITQALSLIKNNKGKNEVALLSLSEDLKVKEGIQNQIEKKSIQIEEKINSINFEINYLNSNLNQIEGDYFNQEKNSREFQKEEKEINQLIIQNKRQMLLSEKKLIKHKKKINEILEDKKTLKKITTNLQEKKNHLLEKLKLISSNLEKANLQEKEINQQLIRDIDELKKKLDNQNYLKNLKLLSQSEKKIFQLIQKKALSQVIDYFNKYHETFKNFFKSEHLLYSFFFSTTETYFQKNLIKKKIEKLNRKIELHQQESLKLEKKIENSQKSSLQLNNEINNQEIEKVKTEGILKTIIYENSLKEQQLQSLKKYHNTIIQSKKNLQEKKKYFLSEKQKKTEQLTFFRKKLKDSNFKQKKFLKEFEVENKKKKELDKKKNQLEKEKDTWKIKLQKNELEKIIIEKEKAALSEKINYQLSVEWTEMKPQKAENLTGLKNKVEIFKKEMQGMGKVNLIAKVEYDELIKETNSLLKKKNDIQNSILNLEKVSAKLLEKTQNIFLNTLKKTNKNFNEIIKKLFDGGKGELSLKDESDPMNSDVIITVEPPGKKPQLISLFSGGEKSLISIAVMYALFINNPSPICLLDEVDSALDYNNIEKLMILLNEMKKKCQIFLISHNQKTMDIIDYIYGISMQNGISKTFSLKLNKHVK